MAPLSHITRLERLESLLLTIQECKQESPEMNWGDMEERAADAVLQEKRRLGYMAVYPIANGCATEAAYEGTEQDCIAYGKIFKRHNPDKDIIILNI